MPVSRMLELEPRYAAQLRSRPSRPGSKKRRRTDPPVAHQGVGVASRTFRGPKALSAAVLLLSTALSLATAAPVEAADEYCSPTGDYCTSATKHKGVRELTITTFSFRGKVDICVDALDGNDPVCKTRTLKHPKGKASDVFTASIKWSSNYPRTPKGKRKVTFQYDDAKIGPTLTFTTG